MRTRIAIAFALLSFFRLSAHAAFVIPENDGFVTNLTDRLTIAEENDIEQILSQYREETSNEIAVLLVPNLSGATLADAAVQVGRRWGVGSEEDNNGILMLISVADSEMMIATGYGLEGAVPDIVAKGIIDEEIAPHFRDGDFHAGIVAGIDALKKHIGGEYEASRYDGETDGPWPILFFLFFIGFDLLAAFFGRSKSWWFGGVLGGVFGLVLTALYSWWLAIPFLAALGLAFDYICSKYYQKHRRHRSFWSGGTGGFGGRGGGGGFGGFSGGSFGGGGASGRW